MISLKKKRENHLKLNSFSNFNQIYLIQTLKVRFLTKSFIISIFKIKKSFYFQLLNSFLQNFPLKEGEHTLNFLESNLLISTIIYYFNTKKVDFNKFSSFFPFKFCYVLERKREREIFSILWVP